MMDLIQSTAEFHRLMVRERAGCDRNEHQVSLLLFEQFGRSGTRATRELVSALVRRVRQIDEIGWFDGSSIGVLLPYTSSEGAHVVASDICRKLNQPISACSIYTYPGRWLPHDSENSGPGSRDRFVHDRIPVWKRAMDIVGALIALVLLSPLFLLIAGIIRAVSPGPAFHKQQRIGYRGRSFMIWKFRTMRVDADAGLHQVHLSSLIESDAPLTKLDFKEDPRIFPFGRFMRRCCLDELPQLINVLRGEMSLVGPRPCMPYEAEAYRLWQRKRFDSLPGMTGLWQVSGKNRTTFKEMLRLDIRYSKAKSMRLDLWIIAKTAQAIAAEYAYHSRQRAGASR